MLIPILILALSADWPAWRGPERNGLSPDTGLLKQWPAAGPQLAFRTDGVGNGFSSLAIAGSRILTMGDRGADQYVIALNGEDGKQLWATKVGGAWEDEYAGPRSTPTVDGDRVYVLTTDGDLVCLDLASGKEKWRKSISRDYRGGMMSGWRFAESPLVDGDRVVFTPGAPKALLAAVDKMTGRELWRSATPDFGSRGKDGAAYSSVVVSNAGGVKQYVQLTGRGLVGVRASDGWVLWSYNRIANDVANIPTPIVKDDYVFAATGYSTGSALLKLAKNGEKFDVQEVYFLGPNVFQNHHGGMVLVGDYLYAGQGHNRGFPICIEFLTGKVKWGGDIRNAGSGSAAVTYADGHVYFRYQNGIMMLVEATPEGYKEKGSFEIPARRTYSWSHPVVTNGRLYLREQDALLVYKLR